MLTQTITDSRAWRAGSIDPGHSWYYPLSQMCLEALDETVQTLRREPRPTCDVSVSDSSLANCRNDFRPVLDALESGRGFAIITGLPCERYSVAEQQTAYWLVGQMLGRPVPQNVQNTLLYDVRDTGQDVRSGARYSVTNAETGFHTDNSFGATVVDYVGLLCINAAMSGGENQVVSAYSAYNELLAKHADLLEMLYQPFHVDRRGGLRAGDSPTISVPILVHQDGELLCRYLRYWIQVGHEKAGQSLTGEQIKALDTFDNVLRNPDLQVEFTLRPGEMFFINNRWILHNRSAFKDYPEPERRRHYVRLWLEEKEPRTQ